MGASPRYRTAAAPVLTKSVDPGRMTVSAVLTYPGVDLDGDVVRPDGGVWTPNPYVNYEHDPAAVVGRGAVSLKAVDGQTIPVGTTHFNQNDPVAEQVFRLVEADALTGVSLEFEPHPASPPRSRGYKSLLLNRDAMDFDRWVGLGWAHCLTPKNPHARTLLPSHEKALAIAQAGRLPGGQPLLPVVLKAFRPLLDSLPRAPSVRVPAHPLTRRPEAKAMDELTGADDMPPPDATDPEAGDDTPPEVATSYDAGQGMLDLADRLKAVAAKTPDDKTYEVFTRLAADLEDAARDAIAHAEGIEAKIASRGEPSGSAGDEAGDLPPDGDGDEPPADDEDDAYEKAFRAAVAVAPRRRPDGTLVTKSLYAPKRFRLVGGELTAAEPPADAAKKALIAELRAEVEAEKRATRKLARAAR